MLLKLLPEKWDADPRLLRTVGSLILAAGIAWPHFAPPSLTEDMRDGLHGFLIGLSLALLLCSLFLQRRATR